MSISYEAFLYWAIKKFGTDNIDERGPEICINSPYVPTYEPDDNYHCQCNPSINAFHCWKTNASGNLYTFVMEHEGCDFFEAKEILGGERLLYNLEEKVKLLFQKKKEAKTVLESKKNLLALPPDTFKISALKPDNRLRKIAEDYLIGRKIPITNLYVCASGRYANRIIIPYYGPDGQLIYFNGRDITGRSPLRYQGPPKEIGVGKGDVVWMQEWPAEGSKVYITEGEFDAMSLCQSDFHGCAIGGKNFSDKQLRLIMPYNVSVCFDLDKYGLEALNKVAAFIRNKQFVRGAKSDIVGYIRPAIGYKDWNDMLIKLGPGAVHGYIKSYEKLLDQNGLMKLMLNSL